MKSVFTHCNRKEIESELKEHFSLTQMASESNFECVYIDLPGYISGIASQERPTHTIWFQCKEKYSPLPLCQGILICLYYKTPMLSTHLAPFTKASVKVYAII